MSTQHLALSTNKVPTPYSHGRCCLRLEVPYLPGTNGPSGRSQRLAMLVQSTKIWVVEDPRGEAYLSPRKDKRDYKKKHNGETEMNPPYAASQWLARDREDE